MADEITLVLPIQIKTHIDGNVMLINSDLLIRQIDHFKLCDSNGTIIGKIKSMEQDEKKAIIRFEILEKKGFPELELAIRQYEQCPGCKEMSVDFDEAEPSCDLCGWAE